MSLWKDSVCPANSFSLTLTSGLRNTKRKVWRMAEKEKEKKRKVGVVPLGSKASCLPSTLDHSPGATLAFGGMGVNCHWCHSAINHVVTRSDGLRLAERKPPAKRHTGKSPHLFIPTSEALHRLISWGNSSGSSTWDSNLYQPKWFLCRTIELEQMCCWSEKGFLNGLAFFRGL